MAEFELSDAEGSSRVPRRPCRPAGLGRHAGDPHGPTTVKQWGETVWKADAELGIADISIENAGHVLLPAGSRDELIAWVHPLKLPSVPGLDAA